MERVRAARMGSSQKQLFQDGSRTWTGLCSMSPTKTARSVPERRVLVLFALSQRPRRHGELVDLIGGISRKVLTQTLRRLQQYGLVERCEEAPRRVEYSLTGLGRTLIGPIEVLTDWARDYGGAIADFQEAAQTAAAAQTRVDASHSTS